MGWKTLKTKYGIEHIVQVEGAYIQIGSAYVRNLVSIETATGAVMPNETFSTFLRSHYPVLADAKPAEVLEAIQAVDAFDAAIPVFTFDKDQILEKRCEALGWPNVTHNGELMYDNQYFADKAQAVRHAISDANSGVTYAQQRVERARQDLTAQEAYLQECEQVRDKLQAQFPEHFV